MKKIVLSTGLLGLLSINLFTDCKVLNFGEANQNGFKLFGSN